MRIFSMLLSLLVLAPIASAKDKLIILSPHRKSIQQEFIPKFEEHYKKTYGTEIDVEWLDQGGTADDIRFLRAKFNKETQTSGMDLFWGGGASTFVELTMDDLLDSYKIPAELQKEIPETVAGINLYDKNHRWYASALSSFGIFYNKKILQLDGLKAPKTWEDLANPKFQGSVSLADPRRSGTATTMNQIIIQSLGWEKGWELLTAIAGNTSKFTHSSTDPLKAVVTGDAIAAMAIDFYANAKVGDLGKENLGFVLPEGQTVIDADPVGILKGAPNRKAAERFINYLLSKEAQKLLILPKGSEGGPKFSSLGRMAVNKMSYEETEGKRTDATNPFKMKQFLKFDIKKAGATQRIFTDLLGAIHIDTHKQLKQAWEQATKKGLQPEELSKVAKMPLTEAEFMEAVKKWDDNVYRNQTINSWVDYSKNKYNNIAKGK